MEVLGPNGWRPFNEEDLGARAPAQVRELA
jgi:arginine-tRNA-protein transferase